MAPLRQARRAAPDDWSAWLAATMTAVLSILLIGSLPAGATSYVPISGEGSSWSANALDQWIADVQQSG